MLRKVDLIWNITLVCSWGCEICYVDAVQVTKRGRNIQIRSSALTETEQIPYRLGNGTLFEQAIAWRQRQGLELDFEGKLRVLNHLEGFLPKIDFSDGGGSEISRGEATVCLEVF